MQADSQFPPSSPLLNSDDIHDDESHSNYIYKPKDSFDVLKKNFLTTHPNDTSFNDDNAYLTPDPSSSFFVSDNVSDPLHSDELNEKFSLPDATAQPIHDHSKTSFMEEHIPKKMKLSADNEKLLRIDASNPLNIKNFENVIKVPLNGESITVGRSGLSCNFKLNSSNKLISRLHAEINYLQDENLVLLKCLGFNGLNITIPKSIKVDHLFNKEYLINFSNNDSSEETDDEHSRVLSGNNSKFTNFYMLKNESIKMPLIEGTVIDFRGELVYLSFKEEATKKQELVHPVKTNFQTHPTLVELQQKISEKMSNANISTFARPVEKSQLSNTIVYKRIPSAELNAGSSPKVAYVTDISAAEKSVEKSASDTKEPVFKPKTSDTEISETNTTIKPQLQTHIDSSISQSVNGPSAKVDNSEGQTSISNSTFTDSQHLAPVETATAKKAISKSEVENEQPKHSFTEATKPIPVVSEVDSTFAPANREPLEDITQKKNNNCVDNNLSTNLGSSSGVLKVHEDNKKRGRSHTKKAKISEEDRLQSMSSDEIDSALHDINKDALESISNILTNHIAYSRISQTPFSDIRKLKTIEQHHLSKLQLQCILIHHIKCIGVIFRQGKDAAGKLLDEQYYYIPEEDSDLMRVQLVEQMKGSSSHLRGCRRKHKQYYWKPPKI